MTLPLRGGQWLTSTLVRTLSGASTVLSRTLFSCPALTFRQSTLARLDDATDQECYQRAYCKSRHVNKDVSEHTCTARYVKLYVFISGRHGHP